MSPTRNPSSEPPQRPALQITANNLIKRVKRAAFGGRPEAAGAGVRIRNPDRSGLTLPTNRPTTSTERRHARRTDPHFRFMNNPILRSLETRTALMERYRHNALLLYALEMRFGIDDILTAADSCITDGPNDRKCDAIYIDRDTACAVIAQSYISTRDIQEAPANKAADLNSAVSWVLGGPTDMMSDSLRAAAQDLNSAVQAGEIDRLELWFCHNLPESSNVQEELDSAERTASSLLATAHPNLRISVGVLEVGLGKLDEWYASIQRPILVADELAVEVDGWFEESGTDWTAICTSIPAMWLTSLHESYGDKLFSANVRGYMPSRRTARNINYNMEETAKSEPGQFWAFNNGVTILVNQFRIVDPRVSPTQLVLNGVAIVNGAQTTGALSRSASPNLKDASVLARFVKCDNQQTVENLIRFNNSQNPIQPSDFRSTDQHQARLRKQFDDIPKSTYLGARRGGQADRARRRPELISSDTAAQALAAFHGDPGTAYHSLRSIWERDEIYAKYFSDFTTAQHIVFVYSLLRAVQTVKANLSERDRLNELAQDEQRTLGFFRQRGSQFLLTASIGHCIEIILDQAIPNTFTLTFKGNVSPEAATALWLPVVRAAVPFSSTLQVEELRGSLRNLKRVNDAMENFRTSVRSVSTNVDLFGEFPKNVEWSSSRG